MHSESFYVNDSAWIAMLVIGLICGLVHFWAIRDDKKYQTMETISTTGTITRFYQESNYLHYIVRFFVGEEVIEKQVMGFYSTDTSYDVGDVVNIAYHINEKGHVTVFIEDEKFDEIKNSSTGNIFLILAVIFFVLSAIFFVKTQWK